MRDATRDICKAGEKQDEPVLTVAALRAKRQRLDVMGVPLIKSTGKRDAEDIKSLAWRLSDPTARAQTEKISVESAAPNAKENAKKDLRRAYWSTVHARARWLSSNNWLRDEVKYQIIEI